MNFTPVKSISHHFSQNTSTVGPGIQASSLRPIPCSKSKASVDLEGGLPTLRLPVRNRHSRTFRPIDHMFCEQYALSTAAKVC